MDTAAKRDTETTKENSNKIRAALGISVATAFMLCVFEPLNLFFLNKREYAFDVYTMLPMCILLFVLLGGFEFLCLLIFRRYMDKIFKALMVVAVSLFVCLYVQGNFLVGKLPDLSGFYIEWSEFYPQYVQSAIVWSVIFIIVTVLYFLFKKYFYQGTFYFSCFITGILFITLISVCVMNDGMKKRTDITVTSKNVLDYSSDTNFIILVADMVRGDDEKAILKDNPEFCDIFTDFTYYDNYTSGYIFTYYALPLILSGEWYVGEESMDEYKNMVFFDSPFINELKDRGYRMGMYTDECPLIEDAYMYENIVDYKSELKEPIAFAKVWLRMVGYKYAPYFLKRYTQVMPGEFNTHFSRGETFRKWNFYDGNTPFYKECTDLSFSAKEGDCFKLIHIFGAHGYPEAFNEDMELVPTEDYQSSVKSVNIIIKAYIDQLKQSGVYDNSVIMIMSDHGTSYHGDIGFGGQDAILFVKGINEHHDAMRVDSAPIAQEDLLNAYFKLLDGDDSTGIFEYKEGDYRERRFFKAREENPVFLEYVQTGQAGDSDTIKETGITY